MSLITGIDVEPEALGVRAPPVHRPQQVELGAVAFADEVEVGELDRSLGFDHEAGRTPHGLDPPGQLVGVRHGGRQADQLDRAGKVDDDLLPHRPPVGVLQVVDLVEYDRAEAVERRPGVEHVAQDLGGHDHDRSVAVDVVVAGQQADIGQPVLGHQLSELLVRQRLDRRGVEDAIAGGQSLGHGVGRDQGLAGAGRRRHDHVLAPVDRVERRDLEPVRFERQPVDERGSHARRFRCHQPGCPASADSLDGLGGPWMRLPIRIAIS